MTFTKYLTLGAFLILIVAATYHLSESPGIWYDEGYLSQTAMNLSEGHGETIQSAPGVYTSAGTITTGYPLIVPVSLAYKIHGVSVESGRAMMVIFIFAFSVASYLFIRILFGANIAALSLILIATFPMLYGNGKSVLGEVPGLFYMLLSFLSIAALEKRGWKDVRLYAASGLFAGLCIATKPLFLLLGVAAALACLIRFRSLPFSGTGIAATFAGFILAILPWIRLQFGGSDTVASTLSFYANPYHTDLLQNVLQNSRLLLTTVGPLFALGTIVVWAVSLPLRVREGEKITIAESIALVFSILTLLSFLRLSGWTRYLFPAAAVALLFLPVSARAIARWFQTLPYLARAWRLPLIALWLLVIAQAVQLVHGSYVAQYYASHRTRDLGTALSTNIGPNDTVFVYNAPEAVILLPTRNYYQFIHPHQVDNEDVGREYLPLIASGTPDVIVLAKSEYTNDPEVFSAYQISATANRYYLLKKQ